MCLNIIIKGTNEPKIGYKVGEINSLGDFEAYENGTHVDMWVRTNQSHPDAYANGCTHGEHYNQEGRKGQGHYIPGFHIITRLEDAKYFRDKNKGWYPNWKIFKCEYTGILAQGFESRNLSIKEPIRVDVASHIFIHSTPIEE